MFGKGRGVKLCNFLTCLTSKYGVMCIYFTKNIEKVKCMLVADQIIFRLCLAIPVELPYY